jgi:hypothetical protein
MITALEINTPHWHMTRIKDNYYFIPESLHNCIEKKDKRRELLKFIKYSP